MKQLMLLMIFLPAAQLFAQDAQDELRRGNELYRQQQFRESEDAYAAAEKKDPKDLKSKYNKANAIYRQNKQTAAIRELDDLSFKTGDNKLKAKAQYNKGVILSAQSKLQESIDAYKNALRLDPADKQARENLQKALKELSNKKPEPEPKKQPKPQDQKKKKDKPQPQMNQKEAEQRLKLLEQKEKEVQQRLQKERSKEGGGTGKDW